MNARLGDRSLFPKLAARSYMNHAGISPPSVLVEAAVATHLDDYARRGAGAYPTWADQRKRLKAALAALVEGSPNDVALMPNTTRGVIEVALGLAWKPGERVIVFEGEFPSNVTPWQRAAERFGLELAFLPACDYLEGDDAGLARLAKELERGARLVAVSAVEFQSGVRMPLARMAALAHARGAELFVDAVQAVGATPIDVVREGIDYLACGSHKWLMGLEGAGFLWVREACMRAMRPASAGWLSHEDPVAFLFEGPGKLRYDRPLKPTAEVFEVANLNAAGCAALEVSVGALLDLGVGAIYAHVNELLDALEPAFVERGFRSLRRPDAAGRSAMLCLAPPPDIDVIALHRELGARGVSAATPDGNLRLSPHWPNAPEETAHVVAALDEALTALR